MNLPVVSIYIVTGSFTADLFSEGIVWKAWSVAVITLTSHSTTASSLNQTIQKGQT